MNLNIGSLSVAIILIIKFSAAHINQQCYFGMCLNSILLPIQNAICDKNHCRCKDGYVPVSHHRCVETQSPGKPCENDDVCRFKDENSYCDTNRRNPICECKRNHFYDSDEKKCLLYVKKAKKSTPLFPMTAIILIACIGIFCGCGIICHNFRRQPELSVSVDNIDRYANGRRQSSHHNHHHHHHSENSGSNFQMNNNNADMAVTVHPPLLQSDNHSISSKYDSLMYDEPPPRYEDAIRELPDIVHPSSSSITNNNHHTNNQSSMNQQQQQQQTTIRAFSPVVVTKSS